MEHFFIDDHCWAEIDLSAIKHNVLNIQKKLGDVPFCAVIKADAYGHGAATLAKFLQKNGVKHFAVSSLAEAVELRTAGIEDEIIILGYSAVESAPTIAKFNLVQACYCLEYARALSQNAQNSGVAVRVHLKIDTGMGRIGFTARENFDVCTEQLCECYALPNLAIESLFQHFSVADSKTETDVAYTTEQQQLFCKVIETLTAKGHEVRQVHINNSAGALMQNQPTLPSGCSQIFARVGIVLYGLPPDDETDFSFLRTAMKLKTRVTMVKTLSDGESASYGRNFTAEKPTKIATLCAGYADGYRRALGCGKGEVEVLGMRAKTIGNVCMDQMLVDVSHIENVKIGDEVTLWGGENSDSAMSIAKKTGTIGYEIVCGVTRRVPRIYKNDGERTMRMSYLDTTTEI